MIDREEKHQTLWQKLRSYFSNRFFDDAGDAVLTTVVIAMPFVLLIGGFAIDLSKNNSLRNAYHSQAQTAAQSAVRTLDARGSLNVETFRTFHANLTTSWEEDAETGIWTSEQCNGEDLPKYSVKLQAENYAGSADQGPNNTSKTFSYTAGEDFEQKLANFINYEDGLRFRTNNPEYRVISAEVHTSSQNILLGMFGMPCQAYTSQVNAGAFNEYR